MADLPKTLPRRQFLSGAACLAGVAAFGLSTRPAFAVSASAAPEPPLSLAFWDGTRFVAADRMDYGDHALCASGARLSILAAPQQNPALKSVDVHYRVAVNDSDTWLPMQAWARSTYSVARASISMPVTPAGTLLSVRHGEAETLCHLSTGNEAGAAKLRRGIYVLAAAKPAWAVYTFQPNVEGHATGILSRRSLSGPVPAEFDYLTIRVESA